VRESGRGFCEIARLLVRLPKGTREVIVEEDLVTVKGAKYPVKVWALRHDPFFDRAGLYQEGGKDYEDNLDRFALFCRATLEVAAYLYRERQWKADLLHLHDWQTSLCAAYLKSTDQSREDLEGLKTVLTLHNVGYQGVFPGSQFQSLGLPSSLFGLEGMEFYGSVNLLKGGMVFADYLTTVSPTYAKEILSKEFGCGLEGVLRNRQDRLQGILNGIDVEAWNPATDPYLPANYSSGDLNGKQECKRALQKEFELPQISVPLVTVIARLTYQKGIDLLESIAPQLMAMDLQLVILGIGEPAHESALRALQARYPDRLGLRIGFDEALAHRIEGGADLIVMPSRYEPCGLSQLYSLRYGTVPVVARTGGLADTVVPFTMETSGGRSRANGFQLRNITPEALWESLRQAIEIYRKPQLWRRLVQNGMKSDHSWEHSAVLYQELFDKVIRDRNRG
jgi:starch synthase